jgi:hypothetical protein
MLTRPEQDAHQLLLCVRSAAWMIYVDYGIWGAVRARKCHEEDLVKRTTTIRLTMPG